MNDAERVRVTLSCHHTLDFNTAPPMVGEELYCVRCQAMHAVVDAPPEYRIRCRGCGYSRRCGVERLDAEVRASKHHKNTRHRVAIYNGKRLIYVIGMNNTQQRARTGVAAKYAQEDTTLPPAPEPPPF